MPALDPRVELSADERGRYARHLILPEVGMEGQLRLKAASVLCVGSGGLGSPLLLYLAAAGIGRIGIVDDDVVDCSNLQRQVIHGTATLGQAKTVSAKTRIEDLNPHCHVEVHNLRLTSANALDLLSAYDLICDGSDNFPTRYLINDACVLLSKPCVYGSVQGFEGQVSVFNLSAQSPSYRDLVPEPPPPGLVPSCAQGGVLGVMPGLIGILQATEAIKVITGIGRSLDGRLLLVDGLAMRFRELQLQPIPGRPQVTELIDYEAFCGVNGAAAEEVVAMDSISVQELKQRLEAEDPLVLVDVRNPSEAEVAVIPGAELIPLATIESGEAVEQIRSLATGKTLYVHCKLGGRSAKAVGLLAAHGIEAINVTGGIDAWSQEIDPSVPRY
ncbi:MAG: molybdopterin-synthase adenylyltransferase MoeB [Synechococcus sp.]|nr:molybdopterin-synthase adenylyltransferase MoeB [Synechococcus sp.]